MALEPKVSKEISSYFDRYFRFLVDDFEMQMVFDGHSPVGGDNHVRIYRNRFVQLELAGTSNYFDAVIRKMINGEPASYPDEDNNIRYVDLAILNTNNIIDISRYYVPDVGWQKAMENTVNLFRSNKAVFISEAWVDIEQLTKLKDEEFFKKWGFKPSEKPDFFKLVRTHALKLTGKGFQVIHDSENLPHYNFESMNRKLILQNKSILIKIYQGHWRDDYVWYYLEITGKDKFEIDLSKHESIKSAAEIFNRKLDNSLST